MIDKAPDQTLLDLAQHLGITFEALASSHIAPAFWGEGLFRVFISHLSTQRQWAADLKAALLHFGISGFVAHNDIEPTLEWQDEIELALSTCDALVALLHSEFHESKWTDQEIGFAMGRGVPVFSVRFGEVPYGFIARFQAFNGNKCEPIDLAQELFEACRKHKQTRGAMSQVLIRLFENSGSFAEAKVRIGYLEEAEEWDASFSGRIQNAAEQNSQITHSWGVPGRVSALVQKWSGS